MNHNLSRRHFLQASSLSAAVLAIGACSSDSATDSSTATGIITDNGASPDCVLTPEEIEGPFYTDLNLIRRDITGGKPGTPLEVRLTVIDADTCTPIPDASVDIWYADAGGLYSAFTEQGDNADIDTTGETFLRGVQPTDSNGVATFTGIYPGWYMGRTTHAHIKVHFDNSTRVTSQLYFPDDITVAVYQNEPYVARGPKDTPNADDDFNASDASLLMKVRATDNGYLATHTLGIRRT